ncbi:MULTISPECIES: glycosyltransferase [Paenibacillus]|uniref:Glycosyltransferase n=1 Tax=Paenibacillus albilobatus TaxID=2716884 RepID=A0A920C8N9_9BACL|nr:MULTISPECIES: glycosyltransferase [Paenibacillus]GIO30130.1 hypothetical protein J2TS6_12710 [Paenibacillus albilobatus]
MKKVVFADFVEYNDPNSKLGNYHYCNAFIRDGYEALWVSNSYNGLIYLKNKQDYKFKKSISTAQRHELAPRIYGFSAFASRLYGNYLFSRNPHIALHQERYIRPNVRETLRQLHFDKADILWISNPKLYWLTNVVDYGKLVYRVADDYSKFKEFPNIEVVENHLLSKADLILATSQKLVDKVTQKGYRAFLVNNGVEYEHFAPETTPEPAEYAASRRMRVIYVGAIKYWFDVDAIETLAKETDADIYLVGKVETDLSKLKPLENVHILGGRPYASIPGYLKHADVAVIPFKKMEATDAVSPIKLYEYCSAGTAVVTTDMEEVRRMNAPVYIAKDQEDFVRGVKAYLRDGYDRTPLTDFGKNNSWYKRYQSIQQLLAEKALVHK